MAESARYRALEQAGLLHPAVEAVLAEPFRAHPEFFASFDKVQVKYEMLRAHVIDGRTATAAAPSPAQPPWKPARSRPTRGRPN